MINSTLQKKIDLLLRSLEAQELFIYELGTPQPIETDAIKKLVDLGPQIVPYLIELTKSETPKKLVYIVLVLGRLGDARAIEALRELRKKYMILKAKTEWEYAVIGQCNIAIDLLEKAKN